VSRPSILISPSRPSLNKRKSAEIKEDLPAPVRPTTPTFQPGSMDMFRFCETRRCNKTEDEEQKMSKTERLEFYLQNRWIILAILHVDVLEDQVSLRRPCGRRRIVRDKGFLPGKIRVLKNSFHGGHQRHRLG